jgi:hypothetical protein
MAFFGAFIAGCKGVYDRVTLTSRIAEVQKKLAIPILGNSEIETQKRFTFVRSILEASLLEKLESAGSQGEKQWLKQRHITRMKEELQMNKQDLEKQPATRADVAVMGLALQEIALCLDEHVEHFKKQGEDEIHAFRSQNQSLEAGIIKQMAAHRAKNEEQINAIHEQNLKFKVEIERQVQRVEDDFERLEEKSIQSTKEFQNQVTSLAASVRSLEQEQKRHQKSVELMGQNLQMELKKLADKQVAQNRILLTIVAVLIVVVVLPFLRH